MIHYGRNRHALPGTIFWGDELRYSDFIDRVDIDAFENAIGFVPMESRNGEDRGQCPDIWGLHKHGDTTGKFSINREKMVYNCWVCGGGSLLSLAMSLNDMQPEQAVDWLYQFAAEEEEGSNELEDQLDRIFQEQEYSDSDTMPYFNEKVLSRYDDAYDTWYSERGITRETQESFDLRISREHQKRSKTDEVYSGPAILIPHYWNGTLVGWQGKWIDPNRPDWVKKYTNTPGFPKELTLFNYWSCAGEFAKTLPYVVVVESPITTLFLESCGIPSIATFGSSVNESQMDLLKIFEQGIVLAADNDGAGKVWKEKIVEYLDPYVPIYLTELVGEENSGDDLGDLAPDCKAAKAYINRRFLALEEDLDLSRNE